MKKAPLLNDVNTQPTADDMLISHKLYV